MACCTLIPVSAYMHSLQRYTGVKEMWRIKMRLSSLSRKLCTEKQQYRSFHCTLYNCSEKSLDAHVLIDLLEDEKHFASM